MNKPYSVACDKNRDPILSVIQPLLASCKAVLEVGSGTGQHAVYFAEQLPHLIWYTSDVLEHHAAIQAWLDDVTITNIRSPLTLDVKQGEWPTIEVDAVFSANTAHIMSWDTVQYFVKGVGALLPANGLFMLYGPFNYNNQFTSESNEQFEGWLKDRDPESGIRNFEDIDQLANDSGLVLKQDYEMPANNRILFWQKV